MSNENPQVKDGPIFPLLLTGRSEAVIGNLTLRQELFCQYITQLGETFDNATLSYAHAYNFDLDVLDKTRLKDENKRYIIGTSDYDKIYDYCSRSGWRLRRSEKINERIIFLLNSLKRKEVVDARMMTIIVNGKDSDSLNAIKEFNSLEQRITKKLDLTTKGESLNIEDREKLEGALNSII